MVTVKFQITLKIYNFLLYLTNSCFFCFFNNTAANDFQKLISSLEARNVSYFDSQLMKSENEFVGDPFLVVV